MTDQAKRPKEVVDFLMAFEQIRRHCDNEPTALYERADTNDQVVPLCEVLDTLTSYLHSAIESRPGMYIAPVGEDFISSWRDYEERFSFIVSGIADFGTNFRFRRRGRDPDSEWEFADGEGEYDEGKLEHGIANLKDMYETGRADEWALDCSNVWDHLTKKCGLDPRGVFRRRRLVPFVLVPKAVSDRYGSAERISMLKNLGQAQIAFVFGAPYAALALMRSVLETVLGHYGADERSLSKRISQISEKIPPTVKEAGLRRLKELADAILHEGERGSDTMGKNSLRSLESKKLEIEIARHLHMLREMIERVK